MASFLIKYVGPDGRELRHSEIASSREQAISQAAQAGIPEAIIQKVTPDFLGTLRMKLFEKRFPTNQQVLTLVTLASKLESGKTPGRAIREAVDFEEIDITQAQMDACELPSDYLKLLRFDETAVLLAEAGDSAGNLSEALHRAAKVMRDREISRKEFAKPLKMATINFVAGTLAAIGFPLFGGTMLHKFIYEQKFPITPNAASKTLMFLNSFYQDYWPLVIGVFAVIFIFRARVWKTVRDWPFFSLFSNRSRVRRGLDFIQSYNLLSASGYTNPQIFKFMMERASGSQIAIYQQAHEKLKAGRELGGVFDNAEWPKIIGQNLSGFEEQGVDARKRVLENLINALSAIFTDYSERIAGLFSKIALLVIMTSIMLFALGFYIPMVTVKVSM
jgi:type II secretory pathway component PulF